MGFLPQETKITLTQEGPPQIYNDAFQTMNVESFISFNYSHELQNQTGSDLQTGLASSSQGLINSCIHDRYPEPQALKLLT